MCLIEKLYIDTEKAVNLVNKKVCKNQKFNISGILCANLKNLNIL
jgi:hypothetical protein